MLAVTDRDARRLLAAVLQRVQAEVGELRDLLAGGPNAEHAAGVLGSPVVRVDVVGEQSISARHGPKSRGDGEARGSAAPRPRFVWPASAGKPETDHARG